MIAWLQETITNLAGMSYTVTLAEDFNNQHTDVVIATSIEQCNNLRDQFSISGQTPLLVLVVDHPTDACADLILPPQAGFISHQIKQTLTMRKQMHQLEDDLERQKRITNEVEILKNAIIKNVSHELKTPLLQVKAAVALMSEDSEDEKLVEYAKGATGRLELLVKNITMLGTSLNVNPGPVIVRDAIEYAKRNLGRIWEHRDDVSRIQVKLEENLPPVLADKQGLSTVLQLLADNALKFSEGDIEIHARKDGNNRIQIAVKDKGIGIAQDDVNKIFETFYQVDQSSTRRYGGTGVGLAIVRLILDHHQAHIHVDSTIEQGSTFSFFLPQVDLK